MPSVQNFCGGVEVTAQRTKFMRMMNVGKDVADKKQNVADRAVPNTKYLAELLGVNRKTIQRELSLLQAKEVVRWIGSDRSGYWVLSGSTKASMQ